MIRTLKILLIIALPLIAFLNTLDNTFVYDDVFTITDNYFIRDWGNFSAFFTDDYFKYSGEVTFRPVVTFSYFIDYSLWHLNPAGFHLTNILLHAVSAVLVYLLVSAVSGSSTASFLTSILFALHPVLAETVNGISYREDILATIFFLGSILLFIQSAIRNPQSKIHYYFLYILALFSYLLALCSKEMAITLPLIVFLLDWLLGDKSRIKKNTIKYYIGFILVSGFYLFLRFVWFHNPVEKQLTYPDNSFLVNLLTMPKIFCSYIKLLFFPISFNAEYIIAHTKTPCAGTFILGMIFLSVIGVITYKFYNHSRRLFFFMLWFFVTLAPMMNIMPIANIMAERYLYLPSVGFCAILAYILLEIWQQICAFTSRKDWKTERLGNSNLYFPASQLPNLSKPDSYRLSAIFITCLTLLVVIPYSLATIKRNKVWINPFIFWSKTVEDSPNSSRAHNNLGMIYLQKDKTDLAIREFQASIALESDPEYHHNLGMAYQKKGMKEEALQEYYRVLAVNPNSALTHNNMGNILIDKERFDEGILKFKDAIRLKPSYYDAHYNLGLAYFKKGLLDASIGEFELAIHYEPDHAEAHSCLGTAYANKGQFDKAILEIEEAIRQKPNYPNAYKNLGLIYLNYKKDVQKALYCFNEFLKLDPKNREAGNIRKTIEELLSPR
ncbi:MAG TPA: tetratricopeptide repeat protein [Candidatus Wunengus sp. YC63]|uniref:tetratricopeptide repeat protein n=1 Tax=unclassified Candidatus Wunengus TaxID=3367695 RepID=UPI002712B149|nr:tetratricopeptide repeat protein [Candidatus Brocadiales bacterium]